MGSFNDNLVTNDIDDILAPFINKLLVSTLRGEYSNPVTMTGTVTLTDADYTTQRYDCNGANRIVKLPAPADANHPFSLINVTAATYTLDIQTNGGAAIVTLAPNGGNALFIPDGSTGFKCLSPIWGGIGGLLSAQTDLYAALGHRNAIINGTGRVNQRNSAYTLVKDAYTWDSSDRDGPDMFEGMATGTAVSAGTFNNTAAANCGSSGYAFKFAGVTLTGTGILYFRYRMEAQDAARFKNKTVSFRCQVYHDVGSAINYTVYIRKANAADNFAAVTAISNSGAISVPSATPTSLPYLSIAMGNCSNGIEIEIKVECGAITTKNFEFTEVQFEPGAVATPYEMSSYAEQLAACMRYCERLDNLLIYSLFGFGAAINTTHAQIQVNYKVQKRARCTYALSAGNTFMVGDGVTNTAGTAVSAVVAQDSVFCALIDLTVAAGLTQFRAMQLFANGIVAGVGQAYIIAACPL